MFCAQVPSWLSTGLGFGHDPSAAKPNPDQNRTAGDAAAHGSTVADTDGGTTKTKAARPRLTSQVKESQ